MSGDPKHILVMGVAGSGKSTIGKILAQRLGLSFVEGDDLHPKSNIEKMSRGVPLEDADRWPWLENCAAALRHSDGVVLSCSALRRKYRDFLREKTAPATFEIICLMGERATISARMRARTNHFMPEALMESQFDALEPPDPDEHAICVDINSSQEVIITEILTKMRNSE